MPAADRVDERRTAVPPTARRLAMNAAPAVARTDPRSPRPADDGPHPVELAGFLHELSARLLEATDLPDGLDRLAAFTRLAVPTALRCTAGLVGDGMPLIVATVGDDPHGLDDLQYDLSVGPSLDATRTRTTVTVADLGADARWPELAVRVPQSIGVAAVPLDVGRHAVGSLTVYLDGAGAPDAALLITLMAFAGQAEVLLGEVLHRSSAARLTVEQIATLRADAAVDHAVGVIVAQRGCDPTEAYVVLHETAQRLDLRPRDVAARLVETAIKR